MAFCVEPVGILSENTATTPYNSMRILLISDTRGTLDIINELSAQIQAEAVIHAGDFGFYDDGSFERLSDCELRLHVAHSDLSPAEIESLLSLSRNDLIEQSRKRLLQMLSSACEIGRSHADGLFGAVDRRHVA
jgi:hypothetical protein